MKKLAINLTLLAALSGLFLSCSSERYGPPADGPEERTSESSKLSSIKTKSDIEEPDVDNLVYLINFENDGGYAMVAADGRI